MKLGLSNGMISLDKQLKTMLENTQTSIDEAIRIGIKEWRKHFLRWRLLFQ